MHVVLRDVRAAEEALIAAGLMHVLSLITAKQ
jgi:hypothetical protein